MEVRKLLSLQRIHLRPAFVSDAERILSELEPESTQNLQFFHQSVSLERQRAYLENINDSPEDELFIIERDEDGAWLGTIGLHEMDINNHNARIGVMLFRKEFRGQKYGSEAIALILHSAFRGRNFRKIYLKVFTENAIRVNHYTKLGFLVEGVLRQEYCLAGEFKDMLRLAIFSEDFERLYCQKT